MIEMEGQGYDLTGKMVFSNCIDDVNLFGRLDQMGADGICSYLFWSQKRGKNKSVLHYLMYTTIGRVDLVNQYALEKEQGLLTVMDINE